MDLLAHATRAAPFRVLLVEDNPGDADLVREALAGTATTVDLAHVASLQAAREKLLAGGIDVVLLDLSLPDATGLEGVESLHAAAPETPIVVLTGTQDDALGARAVHAGAQDYLVKGQSDAWVLVRAMRYAIERHQVLAARARLLEQEQAARAAAEAHQRRMSFLADARLRLAEAHDDDGLDAALGDVATFAVPNFADCCVIARSGVSASRPPSIAVKHVLPEEEQRIRALCLQGAAEGRLPYERVSGPETTAFRQAIDGGDANSLITARMDSHGADTGTIAFLHTTASGRRYEVDDRVMLHDLARSGGLAMENVRLHREMRRAIELREEFVVIASHELRTPLTSLMLQLSGLRTTIDAVDEAVREPLVTKWTKADKQVERLAKLVEDLLDVAKSAEDHLTLELDLLDLAALAREVTERLVEAAAHAGCAMELRASMPVVGLWDRRRMEQIFTNLLSNALKYGKGKSIVVDVSASSDQARLSVRDHGIGIARADLGRIFDRFGRASSVRQYGGLGLGLHIAREIAKAHGGSIEVVSELGEGSTFLVALPMTSPAQTVSQGGVQE